MAMAINAGEVKRFDGVHVYPEHIVVNQAENGRKFPPDLRSLIIQVIEQGYVHTPLHTRKIENNKLKLVAGYGRHAAASFINAHLHDGELERLLDESDFPEEKKEALKTKLPTEPIRVPVLVANLNAKEAFLRNISENKDRNKTTAVDNAHNIRRLTDEFQMSDQEICALYAENGKAKSQAWLDQMRKINTLSDDIQRDIHKGELSAQVAFALADMPEEARAEVLAATRAETGSNAVTYTEVMKVARKRGAVTKKVGLKLKEVKDELQAVLDGPAYPYHAKQFAKTMLGWIDGEIDAAVMDKEWSHKRFKESGKDQ